jgi:cytochrome oxidase Cu insertion factor (SCO1/SenC/PrrC family)
MTGMNRGLGNDNPLVISAFHDALGRQLFIVFAVAIGLALAWVIVRAVQLHRAGGAVGAVTASGDAVQNGPSAAHEPMARLVLRLGFGALWVLDGLLQLQHSMPLGLPQGVLTPAADGAPAWVGRVVGFGVTTWSNHPITAATATVWIQLGLGLALVVAPLGRWSRAVGAASAGWGILVWVFGEAFGGVFTPGASWLFGLPGAALLYVVAGLLLALPAARWETPALGRVLCRGLGVLFVVMGVVQAWPGRGTWTGRPPGGAAPGLTAAMASQMASTPQPRATAAMVRFFLRVDDAHGFAVNLLVVVTLVAIGALLLVATRRTVFVAVVAGLVACTATWVLVQDFGFFGGLGTDPNSMVPTALLLIVALLALHPSPRTVDAPQASVAATSAYLLRVVGVLGASALVLLGAVPMAAASANANADPVLAEAVNGTPVRPADLPAWGFTLTDQHGRTVTLRALRGRVVVLTFLDPVCTTDCPLLAQELARAGAEVRGSRPGVDLVAVDANPTYRSRGDLVAFDDVEHLNGVPNWFFLTGPLDELTRLWVDYGVGVGIGTGGEMAVHDDLVFVISPSGRIRSQFRADPGPTGATASSLATLVASEIRRVQST